MPKEGEYEDNEEPDIGNSEEGEAALQPFSVYVRIRPLLTKAGRKAGGKSEKKQMMQVRGQNQQILQVFENVEKAGLLNGVPYGEGESSSFLFDRVFCDQQTNLAVFQGALQPLIPQLLEGYNVSCFAYGMTGSGKTHTMLGADGGQAQDTAYESEIDALKNLGLCNLAIQNLFYQMLLKQDEFTYTLSVSYVELYNEQVRDLLADMGGYQSGADLQTYIKELLEENHLLKAERGQMDQDTAFNMTKKNMQKSSPAHNLKIVEDPIKGVVVQNLQEVPVAEASDLMDLIKLGNQRRIVANTGANRFSSRSHAILIFNIEGLSKDETETRFVRSKLQIVDLAGSERAASTENRGQRMVEGALINKSLLALGQCINILSEQCKKTTSSTQLRRIASPIRSKGQKASSQHSPSNFSAKGVQKFIPYRDSKLTRLLKDSLGGNTKTVMIACINQLAGTYEETMNTIKYASKAKSIQNQRVKNEIIQKEYALEAEAQMQLQRQQQQQEAEARSQQELVQIQNLKEEIERLRGAQSHVQKVARNYLTPPESLDNSRLTMDEDKTLSLTKLQQRKSLKNQKNKAPNNQPIEQLLSGCLVPNIVMQYNLRYQLQSHEVLKQMHGHVHEEEVEKLHQDLSQAQEDQEDIQTSIIQLFVEQQNQIQMLQQQLQSTPNMAKDELYDGTKAQQAENQNLKYQNTLKAQEIAELEEIIQNMSIELEQRNQIIEEQDGVEHVYQAQINKQQQQQLNMETELKERDEVLRQSIQQQVDLEQCLSQQSQRVNHLQSELAKAQAALRQTQVGNTKNADLDPKALYQMNPLEQNANHSDKSGAQQRQRHQYSQDKTNMESSYLNSCLNITDQINTTLECNTTQDQNDLKPPAAAKPLQKKKGGRHQSRNQANGQAVTDKKSSKELLKKQKSLQRYLSGASKEPKPEIQQKNEYNNMVSASTSNMKYIIKKDRLEHSGNTLAKSQSHLNLYEREQASQETGLDLRNQKFKKMENLIFGEAGPLMSLEARSQLDRMRTIQTTQEREQPAYPKLRQSANNAKFQKNLKPRSHSKLSRKSRSKSTYSKSIPRQEGRQSLHRCHTNMDVIQPQNVLTLGTNHNSGAHANDSQSFTFQSQNHPSFRRVQAPQPEPVHDTLNLQSLEHFQLPNIMNVSGISMEFDLGDDMAKAEVLRQRHQLGEAVDEIGLRKQEKSNPFFNTEEHEGRKAAGKRELYHSKSVLTHSADKEGEIMSADSRKFAHHSKTNSGALLSQDNQQDRSTAKQRDYYEGQRNGHSRGPRVKDLISYAEVRQQSKDRRKQQNAVKNLALNFQNFKNTQNESQHNLNNQMLIVDSIEHELMKGQDDQRRVQNKDDFYALPNDCGSLQEIRSHRLFESQLEHHQPKPMLDQFVEDNNKKMQEIQQIAEQIEMRSIERSQERPRSIKKHSLNTTTEMRNKFAAQNNAVAASSKFNAQSHQTKYDKEESSSGSGNQAYTAEVQASSAVRKTRRLNGAGGHQDQKLDNLRHPSKSDVPVSISPPRRKPNFQVPEYQTELGLFKVDEGHLGRSQRSSNKTGQNTQRQTERKGFNPHKIVQTESHRSFVSKQSESSQIFKNFEKTAKEVRQSLERSPMTFTSRQKLQKASKILVDTQEPSTKSPQSHFLQLNQERSHTPVKQSNGAFPDQRHLKNHQSSMDFQTGEQQMRMSQYFQMNSNIKSPNTLQTSLQKEKPQNAKREAFLDDSIQSIEQFRDLQRQISAKYIAKAFGSKSKNSRKSLSKTPERSHNYAQNLEEFASRGEEMVQTQEKHQLTKYIKHDFDQPQYRHPISTPQTLFSPAAKTKFHLNLELLNHHDDDIATDSKRVNPLIEQNWDMYKHQDRQHPTNQEQARFSQVSSISDRYLHE